MKVKEFGGLKSKETSIELGDQSRGIYFYQVRLHKQGKIKLKSAQELLNEL